MKSTCTSENVVRLISGRGVRLKWAGLKFLLGRGYGPPSVTNSVRAERENTTELRYDAKSFSTSFSTVC